MYKNILNHMNDIGIFGIISILIFFTFFSGVLIWAFALKKKHVENMGRLPMEEGELPPEAARKS